MSADKQKGRVIFHIDMNSFYASVEMAYDPSLKGRPLAIAGNAKERKGIVVTCSYEARARGVKPPMPLWEAKRLCPELIVKPLLENITYAPVHVKKESKQAIRKMRCGMFMRSKGEEQCQLCHI